MVITTRTKPSMDGEAASLPECSQQLFFQFIFAPLTRSMGPLKFLINRVYFQTLRSVRNMESYYLMPIGHHLADVHACIHPFKTTEQAEGKGTSWLRAS